MHIIQNAQTLADILNDPAIPAEAKPSGMRGSDWVARGEHVVDRDFVDEPEDYRTPADTVNAALFWSLSAWLWGRDMMVEVWPDPALHKYWMARARGVRLDTGNIEDRTPVEALAAVVRQVAATPPAR